MKLKINCMGTRSEVKRFWIWSDSTEVWIFYLLLSCPVASVCRRNLWMMSWIFFSFFKRELCMPLSVSSSFLCCFFFRSVGCRMFALVVSSWQKSPWAQFFTRFHFFLLQEMTDKMMRNFSRTNSISIGFF